jgi:hypothetical protein
VQVWATIKKEYSRDRIIATVGLTVLASVICFLVLLFSVFAGMCAWTDNKTLFIKANDPTTKIILRDYGCGATDSGSPIYKVFKVKDLHHTSFLLLILAQQKSTRLSGYMLIEKNTYRQQGVFCPAAGGAG